MVESSKMNESTGESEVERRSDLIIGADGAHSALRQSLLKRPLTNFSQKYIEHGYIELYISATESGEVWILDNRTIIFFL
jgi:kynurenine 3-monooxygenase